MADQTERIVLEADEGPAVASTKKANAELEKLEETGKRAGKSATDALSAQAETVVRITDRSQQSLNRIVAAAEKKAAFAGVSGVEKLVAEREQVLAKLAGEEKAIERVKAAYERLIGAQRASERAADTAKSLEKAQAASRRAAEAAREFDDALRKQTESVRRANRAVEEGISGLEKRAALAGKTTAQRLNIEEAADLQRLGNSAANIERVRAAYASLREEQERPRPGLVAQLVQTGILLQLSESIIGATKKLTVETALYAARTEQLGVALDAVSKASGVSVSTTTVLENRVKALGVTTQAARLNLARLLAVQVDYRKAEELARASQDLGRISGEGTATAFERITHAIVTGQPELLRYLGLNVNLEREYRKVAQAQGKTAETLSEQEKLQIRTNATLVAAQAYNGVYAASLDTVGGRLLSLRRKIDEAKNAIGAKFQTEARLTVAVLEKGADVASKYPEAIVGIGSVAASAAGAVALAIGAVIGAPVIAGIGALVAAFGQFALFASGIGRDIQAIGDGLRSLPTQGNDRRIEQEGRALAARVAREKFAESNRQQRQQAEQAADSQAANFRKKLEDDKKKQQEAVLQAEKSAAAFRRQAETAELEGLARIYKQREDLLRLEGLSAASRRDIEAGIDAELRKENRRLAEEQVRLDRTRERERAERTIETQIKPQVRDVVRDFQRDEKFKRDLSELDKRLTEESFAYQLEVSQSTREAQLRQVEAYEGQTVTSRIAAENRKAEIEEQSALRTYAIRASLLDAELKLALTNVQIEAEARGETDAQIADRRDRVTRLYAERGKVLTAKTEGDIAAARENAAIKAAGIAQEHNARVFESLKRQVEGAFDALLARGKTTGEKLRDLLLLPLFAGVKKLAVDFTTNLLAPIFGGAGGGGSASGGGLGRILGIGGAAALGGGGGISFPGAPGGTPGFAGPVALGGGGSGVSGVGGSLAASAASLKGILSGLGNLGRGVGTGSALAGRGVGGTAGGALLAGGGALAFDGLRRGGALGLAETIAGGALIGAKFGGPIGAVIGGGIGAIAGTIRLFVKGAEEKIVEKVRSVYGVTIPRNFARDPLLGIIKQGFGGNVDVGIRSAQVRDLVELYAMSTGQSTGGIATGRPIASSFSLSGGALSQQPVFQNGLSLGLGQASNASPAPTVIQLDPAATEAFLQGQAIRAMGSNPRAVQGAVAVASRQNAGRREGLALAVNPMLMVS